MYKGGTSGGTGGAKVPSLFVIGGHSPTTFSGSIKRVTQLQLNRLASICAVALPTALWGHAFSGGLQNPYVTYAYIHFSAYAFAHTVRAAMTKFIHSNTGPKQTFRITL